MIAIILKNPTLRLIAVILWTAIVAGAGSAYPYLDPAHFNGPGALAAFLLTVAAALVAHIYVSHTQASIRLAGNTKPVPSVDPLQRRASLGDPLNPYDH